MSKLNRLKFESYSRSEYLTNQIDAETHFRVMLKFPDVIGYDNKSNGYLVIHRFHSPSGLEDEIPVCQILKLHGYCVELIPEFNTEKSGDVLIGNMLFEIKRLKKGTDLANGVQNHFRRAKKQSDKLLLHIDHKIDVSNLQRSIRNASTKYKEIKGLLLVYLNQIIELERDDMIKGKFRI